MALTDAGVSKSREEISTLSSQKAKLEQLINELQNTLNSDENYQKFRNGTKKGEALNNNITRIINITQSVIQDTDSLVSTTNAFLDKTDIENKKGLN